MELVPGLDAFAGTDDGICLLQRCGVCNGDEYLIGVTQPRRAGCPAGPCRPSSTLYNSDLQSDLAGCGNFCLTVGTPRMGMFSGEPGTTVKSSTGTRGAWDKS